MPTRQFSQEEREKIADFILIGVLAAGGAALIASLTNRKARSVAFGALSYVAAQPAVQQYLSGLVTDLVAKVMPEAKRIPAKITQRSGAEA